MGPAYNIICYFADCMYSNYLFGEKRFVTPDTVGIPVILLREGEAPTPYWVEQQWDLAAPIIYNYVVHKARNRP